MAGIIVTVVGARPQFVKAAPVSRAFARAGLQERIVHTGQHYDAAMSDAFFSALGIPAPARHLGVGSANHGAQTGRMLEALESAFVEEDPALVLVYGDTNSTLAGALAAAKLHVPVAHVEAGLRSFNRRMPEEINRVVTDHLSDLLFAPSESSVANLRGEGITRGVIRTGDVMYDAARLFEAEVGAEASRVPQRFGVTPGDYAFATVHRAENTDNGLRWNAILSAFAELGRRGLPVLWPVHPRVRGRVPEVPGVRLEEPLPYFETQALLSHARVVLTDSGGLQKEAAFHKVPCVTLRDETEWVELLEAGVNVLGGADAETIVSSALDARWPDSGLPPGIYGDGHTSDRIVAELGAFLDGKGANHV